VLKLRTFRWVGHGARIGEMKNEYKILARKPERGDHLGDMGVDGRII
jgi:hypothetical protein